MIVILKPGLLNWERAFSSIRLSGSSGNRCRWGRAWWRRGRVELPVQKKRPRVCYRLSQLFFLTRPTSADRVRPGQSMFLRLPLSTSGSSTATLRHPVLTRCGGVGVGVQLYFKLRKRLQVRRLYFCHLFYEGDGTSACNSAAYFPCRNHASPMAATTCFLKILL